MPDITINHPANWYVRSTVCLARISPSTHPHMLSTISSPLQALKLVERLSA